MHSSIYCGNLYFFVKSLLYNVFNFDLKGNKAKIFIKRNVIKTCLTAIKDGTTQNESNSACGIRIAGRNNLIQKYENLLHTSNR